MRTLGIAVASLCLMGAAAAQATISGTVTDPLGASVDGAAVQAKDAQAPGMFRATTDKNGKYTLAVPAGSYDVQVTALAMQTFEQKSVSVKAGQKVTLNAPLLYNTQLGTLGEDRLTQEADLKRHHPPSGPTPRTADGHPDLTGVYWSPRTIDPGKVELQPWAEKVTQERVANSRKDTPQARCLPNAVLRFGPLVEFVQTRQFLIIIADDDSPGFHQVYLDGRPHPPDPYSWYGHNTGKWEGDTLVVDRVGFNDQVWLDQDLHPHSDKLHVVERYRRPDLGHLEIETTVEDPGALLHPFTTKRVADLAPDQEIQEFICPENNQDVPHLVGK